MEKGWRYLAVKNINSIKSKTSKDPGDFYCVNCLHSIATAILSFKTIENKHDLYRGKNCMK